MKTSRSILDYCLSELQHGIHCLAFLLYVRMEFERDLRLSRDA